MSHLLVRSLEVRLQIKGKEQTIVDRLSFEMHSGKTLALVGESGCGKSMTALSLLRILPKPEALPLRGEVLFDGVDLLSLSEKKMRTIRGKEIAMIFQNPGIALNPVFPIGAQLIEAALIHLDISFEEAEEKALLALLEVGISSPKKRFFDYPHQLSGGMKQRVMIAMALICEPKILIADEPTTALDVTVQAQVLELIKEVQKKRKMSLLLITHDMGVVAEMADEVIVMYAGQAVESGTVLDIFDQPAHPYTQGLFQSRPSLTESGKPLPMIRGAVPSPGHYPKGCRFHPRCAFAFDRCLSGIVPSFKQSLEHSVKCWLSEDAKTFL